MVSGLKDIKVTTAKCMKDTITEIFNDKEIEEDDKGTKLVMRRMTMKKIIEMKAVDGMSKLNIVWNKNTDLFMLKK